MNVYAKEDREKMLEDDEIDEMEFCFMEGYTNEGF